MRAWRCVIGHRRILISILGELHVGGLLLSLLLAVCFGSCSIQSNACCHHMATLISINRAVHHQQYAVHRKRLVCLPISYRFPHKVLHQNARQMPFAVPRCRIIRKLQIPNVTPAIDWQTSQILAPGTRISVLIEIVQ